MILDRAVMLALHAFDRAAGRPSCITPSVPILFFGDVHAYRTSPLRVLTVGLNPSLHEFPADDPFRRFPLARDGLDPKPHRYLDAMSAYFRTDPYRGWFSAFEPVLNGLGASYYEGCGSTALHTDICSPVATNPTWSRLHEDDRSALEADGGPLWHMLLEKLKPEVVLLSVARAHLGRVEFPPLTDWEVIHAFERTEGGSLRSRPYEVCARWYDVGGRRSLLIFGVAAQKPFGLLSNGKKRKAGQAVLATYRNGL